jgi:heme-degrading monooxygenase HmoA
MFTVIFEVEPRPGKTDDYLRLAASLRPELEKIDGFVEIERFASRRRRGRVLSLSAWRDEAAIGRWRMFGAHRGAQLRGRAEIFADYRLRVGEVMAEAETGTGHVVTVTEFTLGAEDTAKAKPQSLIDAEWFESLYSKGKLLLLAAWRDGAAADRWQPGVAGSEWRHRRVRIIRDYGMFDRAEAPQYYLPEMGPA